MLSDDRLQKLTRASRSARATRRRAAHLRAEAAAVTQRSHELMRSARELANTSVLLTAICLKTAYEPAWKAREQPASPAESLRA